MNTTDHLAGMLGRREPFPRTMRWPKEIAAGVEALAEARGQMFSTVAFYLLKAALAEMKAPGKKHVSPKLKRAG